MLAPTCVCDAGRIATAALAVRPHLGPSGSKGLEDLGALEVDEKGDIANWLVPGKRPTGMGGAMDLLVGAKRVVVMMEHNAKDGSTKLVKECTLPLSAVGAVNRVITEKGVFDIDERGFVLREISPLVTVEELQRLTGADFTVAEDLQPMFGEVNSRV